MDKALDKKTVIISSVGIVLIIFIAIILASLGKKSQNIAYTPEFKFSDGFDWRAIDNYKIDDSRREIIREILLKEVAEASALTGSPILGNNASFSEYSVYVNRFYQIAENMPIPIYFALRIVDMAKKQTDNAAIETYRLAVLDRLKAYRLIK
ncbi:MAG: hypothetical protein MUF05_03760 [Candidatus Omnitrophica bacterium]|jgi:hypothetical protein|nr:hypothetical protein [Candidatus Omnitrophota bacterium]